MRASSVHLVRRLSASALDLGVVAAWAVASGLGGALLRRLDIAFETPAAWDLYAFSTLILPVAFTLALMEASQRQASWGKQRTGLVVVDIHGRQLSWARSLLRSAIKFTPWQLAHTAVFHLGSGSEAFSFMAMAVGAQIVVVASVLAMIFDSHHRALHDAISGTRVVPRGRIAWAARCPQ